LKLLLTGFSKIVGSNDTEAITHVALSKSKQFLSVCERCTTNNKGRFTIFDLTIANKKKKSMPEHIQDLNAYDSQEFVSSAFSHKEERMIVTLTGEPDWQVFLWNWEREKLIAKTSIGCQGEIQRDICNF
jgi:cyclopropane fatty-acyl-phospholipid synthase-like methyltransferase